MIKTTDVLDLRREIKHRYELNNAIWQAQMRHNGDKDYNTAVSQGIQSAFFVVLEMIDDMLKEN